MAAASKPNRIPLYLHVSEVIAWMMILGLARLNTILTGTDCTVTPKTTVPTAAYRRLVYKLRRAVATPLLLGMHMLDVPMNWTARMLFAAITNTPADGMRGHE